MIDPKSRYYPPDTFDPDPDEETGFKGVRPRAIDPATPVIEHRVVLGDRLDLLALHYYNDDRMWWRILDANPDFLYGGDLTLQTMRGRTILIPRGRES